MKKIFAVAGLLIVLFGCGHAADMIEAEKKGTGKNYETEGNTVRCTTKTLSFEISYLSPSQADMYFSIYKGGKYKNPFPPSLMVFLLSIQNKGKKTATFTPGLAWIYPDKNKPSSAKDYTSLYADLDVTNADDIDERMAAVRVSSFDGVEPIAPGATVKKLLIFPRGTEKFDKAGMRLENIYSGKECDNVNFIFPCGMDRE